LVGSANSFTNELEKNSQVLEGIIKTNLIGIIDQYLLQYVEVEKRIDERYKRLGAMDKAEKELKSVQQKAAIFSGIRIDDHKNNYLVLKESYDSLNDELKSDMKILLDDRVTFLEHVYPLITDIQIRFFASCANSTNILTNEAAKCDIERTKNYPQVITPYGCSMMYCKKSTVQSGVVSPTFTTTTQQNFSATQPSVPPLEQPTPSFGQPVPPFGQPVPSLQQPTLPSYQNTNMLPTLPFEKTYATAMFDYTAQTDNELSFRMNDMLVILSKDSDQWYIAEVNGKRGFVPANYLQPK